MEPDTLDPRIEKGRAFAEYMWWMLAKRIFSIAAEHYGWDDDQRRENQELFLRGNDYKVAVKF